MTYKTPMAIALVCGLLTAGCTQEEWTERLPYEADAVPIAFECEAEGGESDGTYGPYESYTATHEADTAPDLMYNQEVTYVFPASGAGNGYWIYSPLKYWPNSDADKVWFYAYAPYVETPAASLQYDPTATGIIGMSSNTETTPFILYARAKHPEENVDLLWEAYKPGEIKAVSFKNDNKLKHALARVKVSLALTNGSSLAAGSKLLVKRVTFTGNFAKTGKLNLTGTGDIPTWYDQVLANTDTDKTIFIDCNPETNTDSYGIIAEGVRYIDGLPAAWQPAGMPHVNYSSADAATKTNLLCMGDAPSYLYLIPQASLELSCELDYCIIAPDGTVTDYSKTLNDGTSFTIASLDGNTTYDLTLTITHTP